ncbi:MAG: hypothetical protein MJ249_00785 [Kiritimatiellae bacterium]|nr:hypothetical protein [Kiritimatiellia bacterium]
MANVMSFLDLSFDVHLLVEDWRTCYYLQKLFPLPPFTWQVIPVGGCDCVTKLVQISWEDHSASSIRAVGWRDRDFGSDNCDRWKNPDVHVFRSSNHEIENYLLDWNALANCTLAINSGLRPADFETQCKKRACDMLFDVAYCDVLAKLQTKYGDGFPKQPQKRRPKVHFATLGDAEAFLIGANRNDNDYVWYKKRSAVCRRIFKPDYLKNLLGRSVQKFKGFLASGKWKKEFPGKEIFEFVMQNVYHGTPSLDDMVKSIGEYQAARMKIPKDLQTFVAELSRRKTAGLL